MGFCTYLDCVHGISNSSHDSSRSTKCDGVAAMTVEETIKAISYYTCIPVEELTAWVRDYKLISNKEN